MTNPNRTFEGMRGRSALLLATCALALVACTDRAGNESASGQLGSAADKTEQATVAAARKAAELAEVARDKTKAYVTSPEVKEDAAAVKNALKNLGTAAVSTTDDAAITLSVSSALAKDPELSATRIDVETKAGTVRLAGPAPNAAAKARAGDIAKAVNGVATVDNQLVVSPG
ncbi:BON domain-containing protein [Variovorax sp. J22P240]|uniref:BON domain-containing protein n=1 Tax=Variovorax sp. J22P240 TaxID=3053514 RepID=UPI002577CE2E|nr:BON domain-containing protein [Variovorax sp. J22P240]MDL9997942.1 BON domain-containing protein [Variovorax sp. J22P240]